MKYTGRLVKLRGSIGRNIGKIIGEFEEIKWIGKKRKRTHIVKYLRIRQAETKNIIIVAKRKIVKRKGKLRERGDSSR